MTLRHLLPQLGVPSGPPVLWELIADRNVSSLATVDLIWTGDYAAVIIDFSNVKPATDASEPWLRLSGDGGSTFDSGASDYYTRGHYWHTSQTTRGSAMAQCPLSRVTSDQGNAANEWWHGRIIIAKPLDASTKTQLIGMGGYLDNVGNITQWRLFGQRDTAKRTDGAQFRYDSGNVAEGRFVAYGLRAN